MTDEMEIGKSRGSYCESLKRKGYDSDSDVEAKSDFGTSYVGLSSLAAAANLHHATNARKKTVTSSTVTEVDNDKNFVESIKEKHPQSPNLTKGALKTRKWRDKKRREAAEVEARLQSKQDIIDCLRRENKDLKQRLKLLGADPSIGLDGDDSNGEDCTKETFEEKKATILKKEVREAIALAKSVMTQKIAGLTNDLAENVKDCEQINGSLEQALSVLSKSAEAQFLSNSEQTVSGKDNAVNSLGTRARDAAHYAGCPKDESSMAIDTFKSDGRNSISSMQKEATSSDAAMSGTPLGPWRELKEDCDDLVTSECIVLPSLLALSDNPNSETAVLPQQRALAILEQAALIQIVSAHQQREREQQRAIMTLALLEYFEHDPRRSQLNPIHEFATDIYHDRLDVQHHLNSFVNNFFSGNILSGAPTTVTAQDEILIRYLAALANKQD